MKICIVYSSITGNTRTVAEALAAVSGVPCFPVRDAPDPADYDLLALGFWVRLGQADARTQRYMRRVLGKKIFFFGTLGAWPDSPHARRCMDGARALLEEGGNTVLDGFLCQGRVNPKILALSQRRGRHPMTPERRARLEEAARHPDAADLAEAGRRWRDVLKQA
ncbi:MAG: flavodoxin family protein [Desulfovibrio sp.]|uniref:flavodoxin family protein n=1 Tax=Desulfovibrio sp. TaxID=885 RepID=UPI0025825B0F|nr:flavodoxin family protein [Desulfovibrio sp.]MCD7983292.1 flavodoxin family protein [Desulfovibrio sp.]